MTKINPELSNLEKDIRTLREDPKNARQHNESGLKVIAKSLEKHGQQKPIVVTADGKVIAGNGTLAAARDILKWDRIAALTYDDEDAAMQAAFAVVDNRSAELSSWDFDELASLIVDLPENVVADLGFTDRELKQIASLNDDALEGTTRDVTFTATTREVGELGDAAHKCPRCGFEFDDAKG